MLECVFSVIPADLKQHKEQMKGFLPDRVAAVLLLFSCHTWWTEEQLSCRRTHICRHCLTADVVIMIQNGKSCSLHGKEELTSAV